MSICICSAIPLTICWISLCMPLSTIPSTFLSVDPLSYAPYFVIKSWWMHCSHSCCSSSDAQAELLLFDMQATRWCSENLSTTSLWCSNNMHTNAYHFDVDILTEPNRAWVTKHFNLSTTSTQMHVLVGHLPPALVLGQPDNMHATLSDLSLCSHMSRQKCFEYCQLTIHYMVQHNWNECLGVHLQLHAKQKVKSNFK